MCKFCLDPHQPAVTITSSKRRKGFVDTTFANSFFPRLKFEALKSLVSIIKYKLETFSVGSRADTFLFSKSSVSLTRGYRSLKYIYLLNYHSVRTAWVAPSEEAPIRVGNQRR